MSPFKASLRYGGESKSKSEVALGKLVSPVSHRNPRLTTDNIPKANLVHMAVLYMYISLSVSMEILAYSLTTVDSIVPDLLSVRHPLEWDEDVDNVFSLYMFFSAGKGL